MKEKNKAVFDLHESIFGALLVAFFNYHHHMKDPGKSLEKYNREPLTHEDNLKLSKDAANLYDTNIPFRQCVDVTFAMILRRLSFYHLSEITGSPGSGKPKH